MDYDRIQKEWESYLRDRTVSLEYYESTSRGSFSTAQPYKVIVTAGLPEGYRKEVADGMRT